MGISEAMQTDKNELKFDLQHTVLNKGVVNITVTTTRKFNKEALKESLYDTFKKHEAETRNFKYKMGQDSRALSQALLEGANTPVLFDVAKTKELLKRHFPKKKGEK